MLRFLRWFLVSAMVVLLTACGGGSGSDSSSGNDSSSGSNKIGHFVSVRGVSYQTDSDIEGVTDEEGTFKYKDGDHITFNVDKLVLGTVPAKAEITILDFNNSDRVAQALYGLDEDKEPTNGIDLLYITQKTLATKFQKQSSILNKRENSLKLIQLQELNDNNKILEEYREFLKIHQAILMPLENAEELAIEDAIIQNKKIQNLINNSKSNQHFVKRIINGVTLENDLKIIYSDFNLVKNTPGFTSFKNNTISQNYLYRIRAAALSTTKLEGNNLLYQKAIDAVQESEEKEKFRQDVQLSIDYYINTVNALIELYKSDKTLRGKAINLAKDLGVNEASTYIKKQEVLKDSPIMEGVSLLALDIAKDCFDSSGQKINDENCHLAVLKNVGSTVLKTYIDDPNLNEAIDAEMGLLTESLSALYDSRDPFAFTVKASEIVIKNGLSIGMVLEQLHSLAMNEVEIQAFKTALEVYALIRSQAGYDLIDKPIFTDKTLMRGKWDTGIDGLIINVANLYQIVQQDKIKEMIKKDDTISLLKYFSWRVVNKYNYEYSTLYWAKFENDIIKYIKLLDKIYMNNYSKYYNYYKYLSDLNNRITTDLDISYINKNIVFQIDKVSLYQENSTKFNIASRIEFDSSNIGAFLRPKSCIWKISSSLFSEDYVKEQFFNSNESYAPSKKILFDTSFNIDISKEINEDEILDIPFLISVQCRFDSREAIRTSEKEKKEYILKDQKFYVAQFEKAPESSVSVSYVYKQNLHTFLVNANVEDNRLGQTESYYSYDWHFVTGSCKKNITTEVPKVLYKIPKECQNKKTYAWVDVYDLFSFNDQLPFVSSSKKYLDVINISKDYFQVSLDDKMAKAGDIIVLTPKITGTYSDISISYEYGEGIEEVKHTKESVWLKLSNESNSNIISKVIITVTNEKGESVSASANIYIIPLPKKKQGIITFIPYKETYKDGTLIQAGEEIAKQWVIKNITEETLQNVYLKWSPSSYSKLEHEKEIEIGDIAPNEEATIALNISVPSDGVVGTHYGKFTLWYQDSDGKEQPLKYTSGIDAYVIYKLIVKDESEPEKPIVDPIEIDTYSISNNGDTKVDGEEYQKYRMSIKLTQKPQVVKLESESGSTYYLLKDGKVQSKPAFVTDMSYSSDKKSWTVDFRIKKDSDEQHKKFKLIVQDARAEGSSDMIDSKVCEYVVGKKSKQEEPAIDIETYSISNNGDTKVDGEEYQKYRMSIKLTQKPQVVKLESESGSTYYLLKDGKVQSKPAFVTDMSYSSDKKSWTVDFRIKKDSDEQHKKFKLIVQDARAEGSNDMTDSEVYEYIVGEATPVQIESFTISEKDENDEYQWFTMKIKTSRKLKTLLFKSDSKTYYGLLSNWKRVNKIKTKDDDEFRDTSEDFNGLFPSITVKDNNQVWEIVFRIRKDEAEQNKYFYLAVGDSFDKTAKEKREYTVKAE